MGNKPYFATGGNISIPDRGTSRDKLTGRFGTESYDSGLFVEISHQFYFTTCPYQQCRFYNIPGKQGGLETSRQNWYAQGLGQSGSLSNKINYGIWYDDMLLRAVQW